MELDALLDFLKRSRGLDFTGYKRTSLARRFRRRMDAVGCGSYGAYLDYLEVHPEEYEQLFDTLLITVTEFFRDPPAWEHLRGAVLPGVLAAKPDDEPIRVWSAGCASGEEAYTAAIVFAELLGEDAYRERVKIYATDIDEAALVTARRAIYTAKQLQSVPDDVRRRYFERADQRMAFRKDLRQTVIFGRNNLVSDAPISRLDVLICRNTLMYFTAETQGRILRHFHFALRDHGVLMLGKSETMISHRDVFTAVDLNKRIFRKLDGPLQIRVAGPADGAEPHELPVSGEERASRDSALDVGPYAQIIVARSGRLTYANLPARALFGIGLEDFGRPFRDLELSYQPVELRAPVEEALSERRRVAAGEVRYQPRTGDERTLDVTVVPLLPDGGPPHGVSILFEDVSRYSRLQAELESHRRDLELAYEELQSTIDELETTNEELQSANEELQNTNEELQSTNEELERINDELRDRTSELNNVNEFLEAIITSIGIGVAVVDRHQRVQIWNHWAQDMWGLRQDEALDHHLLSLDIGLPTEQLAGPLRSVLGGASPREEAILQAINRRGRTVGCATTVLPLRSSGGREDSIRGAIILMQNSLPQEETDGGR